MAAVALLLGAELFRAKPRLAATNSRVIASGHGVGLRAGSERCQGGEYVPTDAARLRVFTQPVGTRAGQPLTVTLAEQSGRVVARLAHAGGYPPGQLFLPLQRLRGEVFLGRLCVRNMGSHDIQFAGNLVSSQPAAPPGYNTQGERRTDEIRVDYFRQGTSTWVEMAPLIGRRFALFKASWIGPSTMWAGLLLVLLGGAIAVMLVIHTGRPQ